MREGALILPRRSRPPGIRGQLAGEGGFVLVITLLVTAVLVAIVSEFVYGVFVSSARASNFAQGQRAALMAGNGVELADAYLGKLLKSRPYLTMDKEGLSFAMEDGDVSISITVHDELGKASLRVVYTNTGERNDRADGIYSRLLARLKFDKPQALRDILADWIDSDGVPRVYGAESADHYMRLRAPYKARDGYIVSVHDMLMMKDYDAGTVSELIPFVSPHNLDGLINVNTAPKEVLLALSDDMTEELADRLIKYRAENPLKDRSDLMKVPGFETIGYGLIGSIRVDSRVFSVRSRAVAGDIIREVEAVVDVGKGIVYWRET